jgi:hypothetical protein
MQAVPELTSVVQLLIEILRNYNRDGRVPDEVKPGTYYRDRLEHEFHEKYRNSRAATTRVNQIKCPGCGVYYKKVGFLSWRIWNTDQSPFKYEPTNERTLPYKGERDVVMWTAPTRTHIHTLSSL